MNTSEDLRALLFATITDLRDKEAPMEVGRAKAVCEVARELVSLAKLEIGYAATQKGAAVPWVNIAPGNVTAITSRDEERRQRMIGMT